MKSDNRYCVFTTHITVALAISLIVNFSYLLSLTYVRDYTPVELRNTDEEVTVSQVTGVMKLNPDGYGYLTDCDDADADSVFVQQWKMRLFNIEDGDTLRAEIIPPACAGGHHRLVTVKEINGREINQDVIFNRPKYIVETILQIIFYMVLSLLIIAVMTARTKSSGTSFANLTKRICLSLAIAVGIYYIAPVTDRHFGRLMPVFIARAGFALDTVALLKCSFALVVSILYAFIYTLISQRQSMVLENERLKNENLATRYDMLVSQINPHFFFNSLNSLAMLVRENDGEKALEYIDRMSYTFRYILQNGRNMTVSLREELDFAEAYGYMFKIRYEDKIFFDIEVEAGCEERIIPSLSLQPLIDNAVKHNAVTSRTPMRITIRTENDSLVVENRKTPLLKSAAGTGTGLKNLRSRYMLITGKDIEISETAEMFTVKLPLIKPQTKNEGTDSRG